MAEPGRLCADPLSGCLEGVTFFEGTPEAFLEEWVPESAVASLDAPGDICMTIQSEFDSIVVDERTHLDVARRADFSIGPLYPAPVALAVETVAKAQGWSPECLAACLLSTMAFLEHPGTHLRVSPGSFHAVSPNIPIVIGAPSCWGRLHS